LKKSVADKLVLLLSGMGAIFALYLVISEIRQAGFCPDFFRIPACFLVLPAFLLIFFSCMINQKFVQFVLFFSGAITGFLLAIWFSGNQLYELKECPKLFNLPLCYASFVVFLTLILLKISSWKNK